MLVEIAGKRRGRPRSQASDAGTVQALERGVQLLQALARDGASNLTELALKVGMPPSTAHRLLATLQAHKLVELDPTTQNWAIGVESFRIGSAFANRGNLIERSRALMHLLVEATGETANLAQEDDGEIVVLSQADTPNPIRAFFGSGMRVPMHASGIGKALLAQKSRTNVEAILQRHGLPEFTATTLTSPDKLFAELESIRRRGWSFDDEERYAGMRCVAAPIFDANGEAKAGISVSGPKARFQPDDIPEIGGKVKRIAAELTQSIGGRVPEG